MINGKTHLPNDLGVERRKHDYDLQPKNRLWLFISCKGTTNITPTQYHNNTAKKTNSGILWNNNENEYVNSINYVLSTILSALNILTYLRIVICLISEHFYVVLV